MFPLVRDSALHCFLTECWDTVAWPTIAVFTVALSIHCLTIALFLWKDWSVMLATPVLTVSTFVLFTPMHDGMPINS